MATHSPSRTSSQPEFRRGGSRCDIPGVSRRQPFVSTSDADLVRQVVRGDNAAFDVLAERHYQRSLGFAWHMLGSREEAEEVVQESLIRAYRRIAQCRDPDRFNAWLLTIVANGCRSLRGRWKRRIALMTVWGLNEDRTARHESIDELNDALARLSPALREAVLLKHVEGFTYEEIAAMKGVGASAIKMRVSRGVQQLAAILEADA